jgi:hypothetical protein
MSCLRDNLPSSVRTGGALKRSMMGDGLEGQVFLRQRVVHHLGSGAI